MEKRDLFETVETEREHLFDLADQIWRTPELGLGERESAAVLIEALDEEGFVIETGVGGMPTAFEACFGEGDPTIAILGEYDALPGLSQTISAEREPIEAGGPGHGCGHNLFGTAGVGAVIAVKRVMERENLPGRIVFFGCPAEEILVGKVFMARDGAFDDVDAALTWHPGDLSSPWRGSSLALDSIRFEFQGVSAHAAASPESGRSALDAVQLLNTGVEYMREHISEKARVHYSIVDGGEAPNVVPPTASVWYYVRAPTRQEVERVSDWLREIANGAAMMTRTEVSDRFITGCYAYLPNDVLTDTIWENMQKVGSIDYDADDRAFASDLQETISDAEIEARLADLADDWRKDVRGNALYADPVPAFDEGTAGSTDVGDVSWLTPTAQFRGATWPVGTPAHSWQAVAANGDFGREGMLFASKVLAATAVDLVTDRDLLDAARSEFDTVTSGSEYESPLPDGIEPPFDVDTV
ncbi:M20 family metallopeptidase [Halomarina halobia]|uniref:M20 family metallopeptidase n=1 Tax=Halomarina halobia TaxID=3033386 RepID=A0ABD6AGG7_9EURY|nr:M20 family metallopeptidase [Halomarina sp. PSR21]